MPEQSKCDQATRPAIGPTDDEVIEVEESNDSDEPVDFSPPETTLFAGMRVHETAAKTSATSVMSAATAMKLCSEEHRRCQLQERAAGESLRPGTRVQFIGLQKVKFKNPGGQLIRGREFSHEIGVVLRHLREKHAVQVVRENDDVMTVPEANVERVRDEDRASALTMTPAEFAVAAEDVMAESLAGAKGLDREKFHLRVLRLASSKCDDFDERMQRREGFAHSIAHMASSLMEVDEPVDVEPDGSDVNL